MPSKEFLKELIAYILTRARETGIPVGKVRIQKILYLMDVEFFRETGRGLTETEWIFYKFGPYSYEIEKVIEDFPIEEVPLKNGQSFEKLMVIEPQKELKIDFKGKNLVERVLKKWLNVSLDKILDYVYFETEPMLNAQRRGQKLDFSTIIPKKSEKKIIWSSEELEKLKWVGEKLRRALERMPPPKEPEYPEDITEMLEIWDEEEGWNLENIRSLIGHEVIYKRQEGEDEGERPVG